MSGIVTDSLYTAGETSKIAVADSVISVATPAFLEAIRPTTGTWKGYSATSLEVMAVTSGIYRSFTTDPVTDGSVGCPMAVGDTILVSNFASIKNLKFIRQGTSSGAIMITPFFNNVGK